MNGGARRRRPLRLRGFDYAGPGAYFVTLVTQERECLFGEIVEGAMCLNEMGGLVAGEWMRSAAVRMEIELDAWVVMPNHLHGVVLIDQTGTSDGSEGDRRSGATSRSPLRGTGRPGPRPGSLGAVIAGFKASATKRVNEARATPGAPVWQRNYYEHVIRSEEELDRVRRYIEGNPARWELDQENPMGAGRRTPRVARSS